VARAALTAAIDVNRSTLAVPVYALFAASGVAGLVLEAVLLREMAWLVGSSTTATALVLAAFMGGLALGAVLFGRIADRSTRPLALFGVLEIGTALSGAALAWLLGPGRELLLVPLRAIGPGAVQRSVEIVLAFVVVLVPTVLMGGTLPALGRLLIRDMSGFVRSLGLLYGLNALGGAAGVFLAGFFLFEWLGVAGSAFAAAALQVGVGVSAILVDRATRDEATRTAPAEETSRAGDEEPVDRRARIACLLAACAGGAVVLGYEVVWTRLLSLMMRSFSYSFSLMLSLFLIGLCVGAILLPVWTRRGVRPAVAAGWILISMGVYVAASLLWLPGVLAPAEGATSFTGFLARSVLHAAPVVLPPTILSGTLLPLVARGFTPHAAEVGRDVGLVYALNTGGAIAGSLFAGLILLPAFGAPAALVVLAVVNATAGAVVLFLTPTRTASRIVALALAAACVLPATLGGERFVDAFLRATSSFDRIGELLFFHESATDTIAIVRKDYGFHDPEAKSLITNGVAMSATVKPVWRYMALEGHLPVLFSRGKEHALALGVGTGITLGAIASHPAVSAIDAIELSRGVALGLEYFELENGRAFDDPRVTLRIEDGRHYLEMSETRYDIVTIEPPPPIVAGSVHLYSLDFYRLCARRLNAGGVVAQWLPLHSQSLLSARMTARTFLDAFPHVMLWLGSTREAVMIGSTEPLRLSIEELRSAYAEPRTRANLERAYLETPEAFLATYLLDREGLERWAGDAPRITDEHPRMEFFRNQGGNMKEPDRAGLIELPQAGWDWLSGADPETIRSIERENRALRHYLHATVHGDERRGLEAAVLARGTEFFLYRLGCASEQIANLEREGGNPETARAHAARCNRLR